MPMRRSLASTAAFSHDESDGRVGPLNIVARRLMIVLQHLCGSSCPVIVRLYLPDTSGAVCHGNRGPPAGKHEKGRCVLTVDSCFNIKRWCAHFCYFSTLIELRLELEDFFRCMVYGTRQPWTDL